MQLTDSHNYLSALRTKLIREGRLDVSLRQMHEFLSKYPFVNDQSRLEAIENDYNLMKDFMSRGLIDKRQDELYESLKRRFYKLTFDIDRIVSARLDSLYASANAMAAKQNMNPDYIQQRLEAFVQERAMLSIEKREDNGAQLFKEHQDYLNALFMAILVAPAWNDGETEAFTRLLLSPTIDVADQQLLLSAISLSAENFPDINKLRVLTDVFNESDDEQLRQRALVGWSFSLKCYEPSMYGALPAITDASQLISLQMQVIHCLNAEADHQTIQRDIMPDLMENSKLRMTRFGIEETEDDALKDILNPNADDEAIERLEQSMKRMNEMQQQGADIYFGGFSQMKRFTFFATLSNWLMPFYLEHPQLTDSISAASDLMRIMHHIFERGPFCDSDKYSLVLATRSVVGKLPQNVREMMGNAESIPDFPQEATTKTPEYIRRMYLQDLYRLHRLFTQRLSLYNPFDTNNGPEGRNALFVTHLPKETFTTEFQMQLAHFLYKKKKYAYTLEVLNYRTCDDNADYQTLYGWALLMSHATTEALRHFRKALAISPDNEQALRGFARTAFLLSNFAAARQAYQQLRTNHQENFNYTLNYCIAAIEDGKSNEVMNELFRLHYEHEDDPRVKRTLAWAFLKQAQPEKALTYCNQLMTAAEPTDDDLLNKAYCHWALRQMDDAVRLLKKYSQKQRQQEMLTERLDSDRSVLEGLGITASELRIMPDLVRESPGGWE